MLFLLCLLNYRFCMLMEDMSFYIQRKTLHLLKLCYLTMYKRLFLLDNSM